MKRPVHKRIISRRKGPAPAGVNLKQLAKRIRYIGSPEHKDGPSPAGAPRPRADASVCPYKSQQDFEMAAVWLRSGLLSEQFGEMWEGEYPRYIWYRESPQDVYEARLVNKGTGEYKGYPLEADQIPKGI